MVASSKVYRKSRPARLFHPGKTLDTMKEGTMKKKTTKPSSASKAKAPKVKRTQPLVHDLVPKHEVLTDKQTEQLLAAYNLTLFQLPKILTKDPAIEHLNTKVGSVIKITRKSPTAGMAIYYRVVIDE